MIEYYGFEHKFYLGDLGNIVGWVEGYVDPVYGPCITEALINFGKYEIDVAELLDPASLLYIEECVQAKHEADCTQTGRPA